MADAVSSRSSRPSRSSGSAGSGAAGVAGAAGGVSVSEVVGRGSDAVATSGCAGLVDGPGLASSGTEDGGIDGGMPLPVVPVTAPVTACLTGAEDSGGVGAA